MDFLNRIYLIFGLLKRQFIIAVWSASDILQFDLGSCKNDLLLRIYLKFGATHNSQKHISWLSRLW